ncbi:MAG: ABC transporter ATP-binding protein [Magnetococcales bacterium]|nr:ABC transporter ATP-binding protein [Magnetococcales bacterium]
MITVQNVSHLYGGSRKRSSRLALDRLALQVEKGEFLVFTGPNGGGKSTLFRILCGVQLPSFGQVHLNGIDLLRHPLQARQYMGVVFQKPALDPHLTVLENLRIHADLYQIPPALFHQRLEESLLWSGLGDRLHDPVKTLSGGLARQVELIKALLHNPPLLLMDEPTTGLDPGVRRRFLDNIKAIRRQRSLTVVMTSHIFTEAEEADRVAILQQGRLLALDTPANLKATLGREMLVIRCPAPQPILDWLAQRPTVQFSEIDDEIRVEGANMESLLTEILATFRQEIRSLSIKQPDLEDVYIHLTNTTPMDEKEVAA